MDNVHKLHPDEDHDTTGDRPQDTVQDPVQDVAQGIVSEPSERVDDADAATDA